LCMETIYYIYVLRNMARKHYIGVTEFAQKHDAKRKVQ
jgi:predicted GIY-YIG superfamily endonuclease